MPTDLHAAIRTELDDFCVTDMCSEKGKAALLAVLDEHPHVPATGGHYTEHDFGCATCHNDPDCGTTNGHGWCATTLAIAEKLGIET